MVTDSNNQCVQCFDSVTGCVRLRFGARGRGPGQLQRPTGVALMQNGNLAIADYDNKCVTVFEPSGKYVNRIGVGKLLGQYISLQFFFCTKMLATLNVIIVCNQLLTLPLQICT